MTDVSELENSVSDLTDENQETSMKQNLFENQLENYFAHLDQTLHTDRMTNQDELNKVIKVINTLCVRLGSIENFIKINFIKKKSSQISSTTAS